MGKTRLEELSEALKKQNEKGADKDQWILWLLADIAISLATISDSLNNKGGHYEND